MIACLAIEARTLAACVRADHSSYRGAIGGGELRREEQAVFGQCGVELILYDASLNPYPTLRWIDFQDAVHMARDIHNQPLGKCLAVGARSTTARCEHDILEASVRRYTRDAHQIFRAAGKSDELGKKLIDR